MLLVCALSNGFDTDSKLIKTAVHVYTVQYTIIKIFVERIQCVLKGTALVTMLHTFKSFSLCFFLSSVPHRPSLPFYTVYVIRVSITLQKLGTQALTNWTKG